MQSVDTRQKIASHSKSQCQRVSIVITQELHKADPMTYYELYLLRPMVSIELKGFSSPGHNLFCYCFSSFSPELLAILPRQL